MILTDPSFERRLKAFDPNLKLLFDQNRRRWRILEWAPDGSGWNLLMSAEDDEGNPKPLGEWIFNKLFVWRHNAELRNKNPNQFFTDLQSIADRQKMEAETKASINHQHRLLDDINDWRRVSRELKGMPKSDVTAGYRKITKQPKGKIICH